MPFYMNLEQTTFHIINFVNAPTISVPRGNWVRLVSLFLMEELFLLSFKMVVLDTLVHQILLLVAQTQKHLVPSSEQVSNGAINAVKVISGGVGYAQTNTTLNILPVGSTSDCSCSQTSCSQ